MSDVLKLACQLLSRPSLTPDDAGCSDLIRERLSRLGMREQDLSEAGVTNWYFSHGQGSPHLMLLGHTDVVPPGPEHQWTSPPFEPTERLGHLHARGAADMKSSVAAFVIALEQFILGCPDHPGTVSLLLTSDEEGPAVHGVRAAVGWLQAHGELPDACLVGEPSSHKRLGDAVRIGRRGSINATLRIMGVQGHTAFVDPADNPVHRAAPLLAALTAMAFDDGDDHFPATRLQVSNLTAGTGAANVTPAEWCIDFNIRNNPNSRSATLKARIEALIGAYLAVDTWRLDWNDSSQPFGPATGPLPDAVERACQKILGVTPERNTGGGTSDGRFLGPLGVSVVELGPVNASIHKIDECIEIAALKQLPSLYQAVIEEMLLADNAGKIIDSHA